MEFEPSGDGVPDASSAASFAAWVGPSLLAMTRLAKRLAPDADPDDVVQDALARAWQKRHLYDPARGTATTWLLAITADQARATRRTRVRRLKLIDEYAEVPDAPALQTNRDLDLDRAISALPERQQLAVQLHYYVGLSVDETSLVMGCTSGTVKSTLFDARSNLRSTLGASDG